MRQKLIKSRESTCVSLVLCFFFLLFLPSPLLRYYQRKPLCFVCAGKGGGRGQGRETWCFVLAILVNLIIEDFLKRVHVYLYVFIFFQSI